jgi:hypothetical protein
MLLDFVGEAKVRVSRTHNLFHAGILPKLNARLSRPMDVRLKRPQQKSYAYINGLYLLLRATGLGRIGQAEVVPLSREILGRHYTVEVRRSARLKVSQWLRRASKELGAACSWTTQNRVRPIMTPFHSTTAIATAHYNESRHTHVSSPLYSCASCRDT